jgi:hypothetical protein
MSITVAETLNAPVYRFTDPDAFLSCDAPECCVPWVTADGLVVWAISDDGPSVSRFTDRLLFACSSDCLRSALHARGRGQRWSEPLPAGVWLDQLRASLALDPTSTPIGEFATD